MGNSDNETPEEDFARFEDFIDDMSDMEFEERLEMPKSEGGFSRKQIELILNMRETIDEEKSEILDDLGYSIPEEKASKSRSPLRNFDI